MKQEGRTYINRQAAPMELGCYALLIAINSWLLWSYVLSLVRRSTVTCSPITFHRRPSLLSLP